MEKKLKQIEKKLKELKKKLDNFEVNKKEREWKLIKFKAEILDFKSQMKLRKQIQNMKIDYIG